MLAAQRQGCARRRPRPGTRRRACPPARAQGGGQRAVAAPDQQGGPHVRAPVAVHGHGHLHVVEEAGQRRRRARDRRPRRGRASAGPAAGARRRATPPPARPRRAAMTSVPRSRLPCSAITPKLQELAHLLHAGLRQEVFEHGTDPGGSAGLGDVGVGVDRRAAAGWTSKWRWGCRGVPRVADVADRRAASTQPTPWFS